MRVFFQENMNVGKRVSWAPPRCKVYPQNVLQISDNNLHLNVSAILYYSYPWHRIEVMPSVGDCPTGISDIIRIITLPIHKNSLSIMLRSNYASNVIDTIECRC